VRIVRRRLLVAAAILFALGLGIALGSGPLNRPEELLPGVDEPSTSADPGTTAFETTYINKTGGDVLKDGLKGRSVAILSSEDAVPAQVDVVAQGLKMAGAKVAGRFQVTAKLTDPANRQFADGVARQSALKVKSVADGENSYDRVGAALVRALVGKVGDSPDDVAQTIWSAFDEGGLVSGDAPDEYADTVVVVVGPGRKASVSEGHGARRAVRVRSHQWGRRRTARGRRRREGFDGGRHEFGRRGSAGRPRTDAGCGR
jgi:hypothetical protein